MTVSAPLSDGAATLGSVEGMVTMPEEQSPVEPRAITPKDVFDRCNMPSRWERITNVAPKIYEDRTCLAFLAARYLDEEWLPEPESLIPPDEVRVWETAGVARTAACLASACIFFAGLVTGVPPLIGFGGVLLVGALVVAAVVRGNVAGAVRAFESLRSRCEEAESRLYADPLDSRYRSVLDQMITCDEGTLAYCAAKVVSEIQRDPAWESDQLAIFPIDPFDELAEIACSARQIADEQKATERLERNRLRDDPEVREMIAEDKQRRREAIGSLAARVSALADYRDRVLRLGMAAVREKNTASRAMRLAADEIAIDRLR